MSFISPEFVLFFCLVLPLYFWWRPAWRWVLILVASYFFYAYGNVQYVPLIALSTVVDYAAARIIHASNSDVHRRRWLVLSLGINLGILFTYKYLDFFNGALAALLGALGLAYQPAPFDPILPIGISFYTFQSMSYTIDVYRRQIAPEPHLGRMAAYVAFFPQLVAGPIERAGNLLPQLRLHHRFDPDRAVAGFQRILWGFFKKVVIADRLALYANAVYNDAGAYTGAPLVLATLAFAFQIYCDFSAYSDIAIGTAQVMGIRLMENFRQPYFAASVREFWARWHISLSTWFRDYVYIPLGGNRAGFGRNLRNLFIVFVVSGLWHGAGWTFVIWGALHGVAVMAEAIGRRQGQGTAGGIMRGVRVLLTFAFVCLAWVFFRANSLDDAWHILGHMTQPYEGDLLAPFSAGLLGAQAEFILSIFLVLALLSVDALLERTPLETLLARLPAPVRWALYYALTSAILFSGLYGDGAQTFIYFQF